jgi:hypothetical protein
MKAKNLRLILLTAVGVSMAGSVGAKSALKKPMVRPEATSAIAEPVVTSKANLDYERLQSLMKTGDWSESNRLTSNILLTLGGQFERGYLTLADIKQIPCGDLRIVDDLWRFYSGGRSGYQVQAQIWRRQGEKDLQKFENTVGWQVSRINPDPKAAQVGHLPSRPSGSGGDLNAEGGGWIKGITQQAEVCKMIPAKPKPIKKTPRPSKSHPKNR